MPLTRGLRSQISLATCSLCESAMIGVICLHIVFRSLGAVQRFSAPTLRILSSTGRCLFFFECLILNNKISNCFAESLIKRLSRELLLFFVLWLGPIQLFHSAQLGIMVYLTSILNFQSNVDRGLRHLLVSDLSAHFHLGLCSITRLFFSAQ